MVNGPIDFVKAVFDSWRIVDEVDSRDSSDSNDIIHEREQRRERYRRFLLNADRVILLLRRVTDRV